MWQRPAGGFEGSVILNNSCVGLEIFALVAAKVVWVGARDATIQCVSFAVLEALDVTGNTETICSPQAFFIRVLVNYVDTDFVCCDSRTVTL